ncbi:receptor-type tyrosine-protein phosphatase eta-like isoform X8 [Colossoma macropomum]|uniref:receptor-type tyrosine-protein phosphatase eta-like isoform X8 n=1 Tax=Colossoma macropomum TaxID=42526 RepID=UPI0018646B97|nr:receptor-type tyrosine-protein phosphatase eta-like isoform X8 [Colossoma macropomum]
MRRYSFRWTVHGALLGLCVLLQSFSTTVPQSTVSTSAGQTSSGTSSTNSPAASTQGNIITTSAREETSSSTDSPTTSVTIEKTSTQGSGNTTTQNVMNGTVLSSPATSAREETSSSTDSPTTSVTIEKTSTQGSGNTNLNIINLRVTDRNTSSVSLAWNLLQANSDTGTQTNGIVSTSATTTVNNLTDGGNHTSTVTAVTADGSTTGLPVQTSAVTNSEKTKSLQPGYYKVEWTNETVSTTANTSNMSYTVTSLTAGMNYTFIVTAVAADGVTVGAPAQTSAFTKPDVVTNLNVSSRSTSSVSLTWNPPQGMNSYTVEWTDVNGSNKVNVSNTTYTVTNLTAGGKYTFIVTAVAADGVTAGAPTQISAFTNPDVVTNLNISDTSTSSVSLTWDPPQGNSSSYRIKWANGSVNVSNTSYTVTSLTAGVNYTFSVTTVAADGITSGASVQTSAFTKPDIVTNLTSNSTTTSVTLTWNLRQGGSSFYTVAWTSDVLHNVNTPDTSYTVTGLTAGVNYTFTVTAVAADNVTAGSPVQISAFTKPGTVTNLTVSDRSTSSVSLTWNLPQGNNSSYTVEWTDVNGSNKVNVSNTTYTVTNLTAGGKYTFIVTAVAADGVTAGAPTQISAFTKPDIVTNLTSNSTTTSVTLTWNLRQGGSSFYTVAWTSDVPYNRNTPDTSYTVTGLTAGVNYTFTVTAVAADNVTAGSPVQISAFTKPGAVTNLTVSDRSTSSVSLTWNLPQGNSSSYTVEWTDVNGSNKVNVSNTTYTVTNLTAGGKYTFIVTAVAADGVTAGAPTQISAFTKPDAVTNLTISDSNTSSVSLTWNSPQGNSSFYRVGWTDGNMYINATTSNTSYTVTNLTPGVNYTFSVTAVAGDGVTAGALVQTSTFTNPDVVSNLNVSDKNTSSVFLIWILQHGNSFFFRVEWTGGSATTSLTSYMATNLTAGMNYTFSVTAVAADGKTTGATTQISTFTKPEIIQNLTIIGVTTSSVLLNWINPVGESSYYRVQYDSLNKTLNQTTQNTTINITDLIPGVQYMFRVFAVAADNSTEGSYGNISTYTKPEVIRNLTVTEITTTSLFINWTEPIGQRSFFKVQWTCDNETSNANTSQTFFNITNLIAGVNYYIIVSAVAADNSSEGNLISLLSYTKPDIAQNLTVVNVTTSSVLLNWIKPVGESSYYRVQYDNFNKILNQTTQNTTINITDLTPGVQYMFRVYAVAADNSTEGNYGYISTYTKPDIIQNLTVIGVTTSSVLLNWFKPVGESSCYRVQYDNFNMTLNQTTQNTTINITDLIPGVQYMFRVFAVAADNSTEGNYGNISTYTKPDIVQKLTVVNVTTSSILLNWFKPVGESSYYRVQYDSLTKTLNRTTQNTMINITDLIPGVQYMFRVYAVAADNSTEGSYGNISSYTKPDIVQNLTVIGVTTSSVLLNWIKPVGESSYYRVQHDNFNMTLNQTTQNTTIKITDLIPGAQYMFRVFAVAADNSTEGNYGNISTYTKPEVIRNLTVPEITATSLFMNWTEPIGQRSFFKVQWTYDNETSNATTSQTFFNITNLIPGGYYYIRVSAVAADNKTEGEVVTRSPYTRPEIIRNLNAFQISTRNVSLNWTAPTGKSAFFRVLGLNESVIFNKTTKVTSFDITDLTPGLNFTFHVSAIAADNFTEGGVASLSVCTDASPVLTYSCEGPNHTDASLNITWMKPPGFCHGFNLSGTYISQNTCNRDCHHIISNLQYGMPYNVTITTLACGQSGIQNFVCTTGFTDPPVPTKPADLIFSPGSNQKRTVVQFSGSLLNGSKGEITAYGVLLSTDFDSNPNRTDLKNTYTDWTQKKSKSYLTVLKLNEKSMDRTEMIQIEIGTDETIQGTNYTNAPLEPNRYRVAVVLFTYLHISDGIVDTSLSFVSITPFATATIDIPNPLNIVGIVLGVLFFIIIILIIVIIVFIKLKRQRKKNDTGIPITTIRTKISIPVKVVDYEVYFKKQQADSNCGFAEEYEDLKVVGTAQNKSSALALENKGKNRYNNVLPYDSSRVKLSTHGSPFDDYINANYIAGYNSKKEYIAAQGPLPATVNEFWRMIWEKHVQTIVMLTKCNEQGRVKCEKYWPSGTKTYSNITVTNISEIALEDWTISDFTIRNVKTAESREVRHFHFTAWPDHGVPETTEVLINFRHLVREHMDQYSRHSPSVVHCSAGVGRTGTFIALDHLIFQIERESMVDIFGIVYDMRMHRPLMVQTEDQYVFLNQCAVDIIKSRMGTNVDLIYQNAAAFNVYGNVDQRWH